MGSPFESLKNGTLTFEISGSGTTTDELGNVVANSSSDRRVEVYLKRAAGKQKVMTRFAGVEETAVWFEGYCVAPQTLPTTIVEHMWARAEIGGTEGYFCLGMINAPYGRAGIGSLVEKSAGTKIEGWFQASLGG